MGSFMKPFFGPPNVIIIIKPPVSPEFGDMAAILWTAASETFGSSLMGAAGKTEAESLGPRTVAFGLRF